MTAGAPLRLLAGFATPLLMANLLQLAYAMVDAAVLGRMLGVDAFASVGATGSMYWMALSAAIGISQGFGTVLAQRFGAKDQGGLRRAFATSVALALAVGAAISCAGLLCGRRALALLGTPPELLGGAALYLGVMLGGMPVTCAQMALRGMLGAMGDSRTPLRAMAYTTALNIALDVALAIPFGIAGVASATLLSQAAAGAYCARALRGVEAARASPRDLDARSAKALLRIALPLGLRNSVIEAGGVAVQRSVNGYGADVVAGVAAAKSMYSMLLAMGGAVEAAVATFVAQNFGAGEIARVRRGVSVGLRMMLAASGAIAAAALLFGRGILGLLIAGEPARIAAVLDVGQRQLGVLAAGIPILHVLFLYRSALQGVGDTLVPMLSGFLELAGRFLALLCLVPLLGIWGVYASDVAGWILAAAPLAAAYCISMRRLAAGGKAGREAG